VANGITRFFAAGWSSAPAFNVLATAQFILVNYIIISGLGNGLTQSPPGISARPPETPGHIAC
jgi:hypothetical protein